MRRGIETALATGTVLVALVAPAQADHHLVSVSEVMPSTPASDAAEFVEFRMYSPGQGNFAPAASITFLNAAGDEAGTLPLPDVTSEQSQDTLLVMSQTAESEFGVQGDLDYVSAGLLSNSGGGACLESTVFEVVDCVAWGTAGVPAAGTPAGAIPSGQSLVRDIGAGCNTLLEGSDDTNSSLADFSFAVPSPEQNSAGTLNSGCPNTSITKGPKARTSDRTPTFEFSGGNDYDCNLDGAGFADCAPTYEPGRLGRGEHVLKVRARESDGSLDGTPAKHSWKIVRRR